MPRDDTLNIPSITGAFSGDTDTRETHMSGVTFGSGDESPGRKFNKFAADIHSAADRVLPKGGTPLSINTERSGNTADGTRKINREDVRKIFKTSATMGTVTWEQLERIANMHDKLAAGVDMDFNYLTLLLVASVVAGLGLALDSSTTVISSMLLSPIMGPVLGMSYGLVIWDWTLIKRSMRNETVSIVICVLFGVLIGLCTFWTDMAREWPTNEMLSRGTRTTFLAGFPIAFFSGLGVAVSVLDDQTSSLVGVAISASLLPPAVNCGMMFIVAAMKDNQWDDFSMKFQPLYPEKFDEAASEIVDYMNQKYPSFSSMGILSLMLTVANVIMVAAGSALMFRAKEVLPVKKKVFWDDLKIARRIYQGRTVDPLTGEPLTIDDLLAAYIERKKSESDSRDELTSAMRPEVDVVSHARSLQDENAVELERMHLDHKVSE